LYRDQVKRGFAVSRMLDLPALRQGRSKKALKSRRERRSKARAGKKDTRKGPFASGPIRGAVEGRPKREIFEKGLKGD